MGYSKTQFMEQIKETSSFFSRSNEQIWEEISVFAAISCDFWLYQQFAVQRTICTSIFCAIKIYDRRSSSLKWGHQTVCGILITKCCAHSIVFALLFSANGSVTLLFWFFYSLAASICKLSISFDQHFWGLVLITTLSIW